MSTSARRFGKYELQERLGRGGMAEVWKAFDTQLRRHVAIKLLHADLQADPSFITRFEREAQVIASLHHSNIVQIYDFHISRPPETEDTVAYMVMDYVEGPTLADYIRTTSRVGKIPSPVDIVHLFTPIAIAVDYAHQKNMVHRDIKPANILLDRRNTSHTPMGEPILSDFGIAKLLGATTGTLSGWWLGTPLYISPEQAMGSPGNERSDIYSLGIILYEICTGVLPFQGDTPAAIMMQHVNAMPTSPALINPNIPPALTMVILRSIAKDPAARFPTASSMVAALAESLNLPVPENLDLPAYPLDAMYSPTYLSPARPNIPPGMTPSGTSLPTIAASPTSQRSALSTPQFTPPGSGQGTPATPTGSVSAALGASPSMGLSAPNLPAMTPPQPTSTLSPSSTLGRPSPAPATPLPPSLPAPAPNRRRKGLFIALIALLIIALVGSGLGAFFLLTPKQSPPPVVASNPIVGYVYFTSSGHINETSNEGINDQLLIDLRNISNPASGKAYYAWLMGDKNQSLAPSLPLGRLTVNNGAIRFVYQQPEQKRTNLLSQYSQFLVTAEDASVSPVNPSSTWLYYAELPQKPSPTDAKRYSVLNHLRHLLAEDPVLDTYKLAGGLNIWFFRNTQKVHEWSGAARDDWTNKDPNLMHRQLIRILEYLDGLAPTLPYIQQDVPDKPLPILVNSRDAQVPLLTLQSTDNPVSYLIHIGRHMKAMKTAPGASADKGKLTEQINTGVNYVNEWLTKVRQDAKQLVILSNDQLLQQSSLDILNDMAENALYAFLGRIDPSTSQQQEGAAQIYLDIQKLSSFDVTAYKA